MGTRARSIFLTLVVTSGVLVAGTAADAAGTGGAPGGSFVATCVIGPLSESRTFTAAGPAPDSVAPGAAFDVDASVNYPVPASATAGFADVVPVGAPAGRPTIVAAPGAPSIEGTVPLTADG